MLNFTHENSSTPLGVLSLKVRYMHHCLEEWSLYSIILVPFICKIRSIWYYYEFVNATPIPLKFLSSYNQLHWEHNIVTSPI